MDLYVGNSFGMNLDRDVIHFGTAPPGAIPTRHIDFSEDRDLFIEITARGELAEWISVTDNEFNLKNGEYRRVDVIINIPENADYKKYTGKLIIKSTPIINYI